MGVAPERTSEAGADPWILAVDGLQLMAWSTTNSGVVTLPQSCSQLAIWMASHFVVEGEIAKGPLLLAQAASVSMRVSSGTRWQWPPRRALGARWRRR